MPTTYLSPGVYVEEVPSGSAPIVGVGTSTAAFIGVVPDSITIPTSPLVEVKGEVITKGDSPNKKTFDLKYFPVNESSETFKVRIGEEVIEDVQIKNDDANKKAKLKFTGEAPSGDFTIDYLVLANQVTNELVAKIDKSNANQTEFELKRYPVITSSGTYKIKIDGSEEVATLSNDETKRVAKVTFNEAIKIEDDTTKTITADYQVLFPTFSPVGVGEVKLCTNFNEFKKFFGDFSTDIDQRKLAHAVYGFFNNGGSRCYVTRVKPKSDITVDFLETLEAIDEIAIVAAPGITSNAVQSAIVTHCQQKTGDRFAIFDSKEDDTSSTVDTNKPDNSNYAAFYFPWIQVFDPATKTMNPNGDGLIYVPPSGHIAGIYARTDTQRGVHKAPANEVVLGALGVKEKISKNKQDGLNPQGINCIRDLNGNIRVWGARTIGGDANGEFKYINVRRLFLFLRESIDEGTQWTVFEPNTPDLWARIRRNVTAFLMTVWRSGALFGNTPEQAFYVKCDEENNPPEVRDQGQVIIEIGVAVTKPAEFVIFRISQWAGPGAS